MRFRTSKPHLVSTNSTRRSHVPSLESRHRRRRRGRRPGCRHRRVRRYREGLLPTATTVPEVPTAPPPASSGNTITVPGTGTVQVEPDTATVNLGVQVSKPTGAEAMEQVNADAAALTEALIAAGIAEEDIQTSGLSLCSTTGDDGSTVTGYNASLTVNVTIRDIEAVGSTIDAASKPAVKASPSVACRSRSPTRSRCSSRRGSTPSPMRGRRPSSTPLQQASRSAVS